MHGAVMERCARLLGGMPRRRPRHGRDQATGTRPSNCAPQEQRGRDRATGVGPARVIGRGAPRCVGDVRAGRVRLSESFITLFG